MFIFPILEPAATNKFPFHFTIYITKHSHYHSLGCKAGDACHFLHDPTRLNSLLAEFTSKPKTQPRDGKKLMERPSDGNESSSTAPQRSVSQLQAGRRYVPPPTGNYRVVQRPIPRAQLDDPREFQVQQLRRRFSPTEKVEDNGTAFAFTMEPSDPDFPFDMERLECVLHGTHFRGPYCCFRAVCCALKQVSRVICSRDMSYCLAPTRERKY